MARIALKGSERLAVPGARVAGPTDAAERMRVSIIVRRGGLHDLRTRVAALSAGDRSRGFLTREEFARLHGAAAADLAAVRAFAAAHGLVVALEHAARRTVILEGSASQFSAAFGVQLHRMNYAGGTYRGRTGAITRAGGIGRHRRSGSRPR